jgi:transmembrane sensor
VNQSSPLSEKSKTSSTTDSEMVYLSAGKDRYPSKSELIAEANLLREKAANRKNLLKGTVALFSILLVIWGINPELASESFSTNYSERLNITLKDGSAVLLNANSSLISSQRLRSREILLVQGEALFTIKHEIRPFIVKVDRARILDIGTVFNIIKWNDSFVTTVTEGEIEIYTGETKQRLVTGSSIKVTGDVAGTPYAADLEMITAWQSGKIMFNGTALKEAVSQIQRYRKAPIRLEGDLQQIKITGIYDIKKIDTLIDSLPSIFPVKVNRLADGEISISKK